MGTTVTGSKGVQTVHQTDTEVKPTATPPPLQRTEADPHMSEKVKEGSRQHAEENKSQNDLRSQMLKNQLASEVSDPSFRNLGQQFAKSGKTDPGNTATVVQHTWNNLPISSHGPIAYETAKNLTDQDLQTLVKTKEGREFLQKIENGMMDGNIEPAHQAQIDRIRKAHLAEALPTKELSNALLKQATAKGPVDGPWLAKELTQEITKDTKNGARTANDVLDKALPADRPRIAAALTKSLSSEQLQELAKTPEGRKLIDRMSAQNIPYAELKKLASVPDGEKDPLKRSEKAMAMAERMVRAAGPKDQDDAIAMLARTKKQLVADGHGQVFERSLNSLPFQQLLGPFGLRHLEGPGSKLVRAHLDNFDDAVRSWEKMKPADRELVRNRLRYPNHQPPMGKPSQDYDKVQKEAQANDTNQTIKKLADGTVYNGPLKGLKDAEQAAKDRITMARYQGARTDGPFGLVGRVLGTTLDKMDGTDKWADRLALAGKGADIIAARAAPKIAARRVEREVANQSRTNSVKSEAKSGQQSNVGTAPTQPIGTAPTQPIGSAPTQPAQQKGQQPNVGTAPTQPAQPKGPQTADSKGTLNSEAPAKGTNTKARDPHGEQISVRRGDRYYRLNRLPRDSQNFTINTPKGPENVSGLEYRLRVMEAKEWVTKQHLSPGNMKNVTGAGPSPELYRRAQEKFGLDNGWYRDGIFNPLLHKIESGQ